jgi:hypothetical protein
MGRPIAVELRFASARYKQMPPRARSAEAAASALTRWLTSDSGVRCGTFSANELLTTIDVVRRAGKCRVGHDANGERRDVGRFDNAADRQRGSQLLATGVESVAEELCRQRRVDEAGCDEVDVDRRKLEREAGNAALPPMMTTVCPSRAGSRWLRETDVAVLMIPPRSCSS